MPELVRVKALCDVELYDPLKKDEVREIPSEIAEILIAAGLAQEVRKPTKGTK